MATIYGTAGDDTLKDTAGNDAIYGLAGGDTVTISQGVDVADGGTGYNRLIIDYSWATLPVVMTAPSLSSPGYSGTVSIGGQVTLDYAHFSLAQVTTGSGDDTIYGDFVSSGAGDDLIVTDGGTPIDGGAGNDTVSYVNSPGDTYDISGHWFTDGVVVDLSQQEAWLGGADPLLGIENVIGSQWSDDIDGDDGDNRLEGGSGADSLHGASGNDTLIGGLDNDDLDPGVGDDVVDGGGGIDNVTFDGATGAMVVKLAAGFARGEGHDLLANVENVSGSSFNDVLVGDTGGNVLGGGNGADTLMGDAGNDVLYGDLGADRLYGGDGADRLFGHDDDDYVDGGDGDDQLDGGAGNDRLVGGAGNDVIDGSLGRDIMMGSAGADQFVFRTGDFSGRTPSGADVIRDFNHSEQDIIQLTNVDADTTTVGDENFTFIGTEEFHRLAGELRFQQVSGNTYISGDRNGDGVGDFMIRLDGVHDLVAGDFAL